MARSRFRYGICCLHRRGRFADDVEAAGIPVFDLGFRKRNLLSTVFRLATLLRRKQVKVLHTHLFWSGLVGRLAAWLVRTPIIITHEHGKTLWKSWYHRWFERLALPCTDLRIAVSQDIVNLRLKHEHTPPSKIRLIYNAVDPAAFEVDAVSRHQARRDLGFDNFFVIGTIGRLVEPKSYDLLLEVAREICSKRPEARFVLVGEGPLEQDLRDLRDAYGLADKVNFLGLRSDIPGLMAAMDIYIITSKREGLPVSLIEAMMAAKPIVATSVGGIPDTVSDGQEAVLVGTGDKDGLVGAVIDLMDDSERRARLGASARKRAIDHYSPAQILSQLEAVYRELLQAKGFSPGDIAGWE
jgi:glycosyltransferase involved in cell wall biosynthesis